MTHEEAKIQIQAIPEKIWDQLSEPDREAMEMAFSALQAQELSKNSPKLDKENGDLQPTCNQLATDTISRQEVIDALTALEEPAPTARHLSAIYDCEDAIKALPHAQPKIIMCKDCVCGHGEVWLFGNGGATAYGYCGRTHLQVLPYDYCSWAERKTNGSD